MSIEDLIKKPSLVATKETVLALGQALGLPFTAWLSSGAPSGQWIELLARANYTLLDGPVVEYARAWFLEHATDPGDEGDLALDQTPRAGSLSRLGKSFYNTVRREQTQATGFITLTNTGSQPTLPIPVGGLTFSRSTPAADGSYPKYKNTYSADYSGPSQTLIIGAGGSITVPIASVQLGTVANATSGQITDIDTTSYGLISCTNALPVLGSEREARDVYIARCRNRGAGLAPGGPAAAYLRAATTAKDGTPLQRYDGSGPVLTTRAYVSPASASGVVTMTIATDSGTSDATDVTTVLANVQGVVAGTLLDPSGVLPDCVTFYLSAAPVTTITTSGSVKVKTKTGITSAIVKQAIVDTHALVAKTYPLGGYDQTLGAGTIYLSDIIGLVMGAGDGSVSPKFDIYSVTISSPGGNTAIGVGGVPVFSTATGSWTVTFG